jgi:2-polyprenyl-3-methyl-5-hydroxy-6-metoxy-1,4-benzoquinol methylase
LSEAARLLKLLIAGLIMGTQTDGDTRGGFSGMNDAEREAIFFIADISGYTKFIFSNEKEISHSQMVIRELITTLMDKVVLPLNLVRIEGDAIFLYVLKDDPEHPWETVSKTLATDMIDFFQVFSNKLAELMIHKVCNCNACINIEQLKLKVVAHSGTAAFYRLGEHQELTGTSPIVIHRLMKNSVQATEYMLFTESAFQDIAPPEWKVEENLEDYDDIGAIKTFVYYPPEPEPYVLSPDSKPPAIFIETLRSEVSREYCQVAQNPELGFHFHTGRRLTALLEYQNHWLEGLPEEAIESFAGTGNPFMLGDICPSEKVVDAGCGAGLDCIIASKMAGAEGEIVGIDMTQEMVDKARSNAQATGVANVSFQKGIIEELPVADEWADVIISNGSINLAPDKDDVFKEFNRVLKPGGRLQVADILVDKPIPESAKRNIDLWTG